MRFNGLYRLLSMVLMSCLLSSCSDHLYDKLPRTGFTTNYRKETAAHSPFLSFYLVPDKHKRKRWNDDIAGNDGKSVRMFLRPINIAYMTHAPQTEIGRKEVAELANYFYKSLREALKKEEAVNPHFHLVDSPQGAYILEVAITAASPNNVSKSVISSGVGMINPVASAATTVASMVDKKGYTAMAAKVFCPDGSILAEWADYHENAAAITGVDFKQYSRYAMNRRQLDEWSRETAQTVATPVNTQVKGQSFLSKLNPF